MSAKTMIWEFRRSQSGASYGVFRGQGKVAVSMCTHRVHGFLGIRFRLPYERFKVRLTRTTTRHRKSVIWIGRDGGLGSTTIFTVRPNYSYPRWTTFETYRHLEQDFGLKPGELIPYHVEVIRRASR